MVRLSKIVKCALDGSVVSGKACPCVRNRVEICSKRWATRLHEGQELLQDQGEKKVAVVWRWQVAVVVEAVLKNLSHHYESPYQ